MIGPAPPFALTSQDGKPVALAALRGKVVAVTFIYTGCPDICPLLTEKMAQVQDELGDEFWHQDRLRVDHPRSGARYGRGAEAIRSTLRSQARRLGLPDRTARGDP